MTTTTNTLIVSKHNVLNKAQHNLLVGQYQASFTKNYKHDVYKINQALEHRTSEVEKIYELAYKSAENDDAKIAIAYIAYNEDHLDYDYIGQPYMLDMDFKFEITYG